MNFAHLLYWIEQREAIRRKRASGEPGPWTWDPILAEWSFTNVRREHDRTSCWVAHHWREPHRNDDDVWFGMVLACFINWPPTLAELGWPIPWNPDHFRSVMAARAARGDQVYGGAYRIRPGKQGCSTAEYQCVRVLTPLWRARTWMRPRVGDTLGVYGARLGEHHGFGTFMVGQVVAATKYVAPLLHAADWSSFVVSGPGSRRGLARVMGLPPDHVWSSEAQWRAAFDELRIAIAPDLEKIGLGDLHAQDLQNCLCELDKFLRVRPWRRTPAPPLSSLP